ncbi:DUF6538 domain-containing protein [Tranquillimonas rosea]|uniref:DUF6538 domain-containing protein n=1 Tax=Tranquillimonas rosea TaxID=641238 RepID=UPI003BAD53F6
MSLHLRNKTYHLKRRVPRRYRCVESRSAIWVSLRTDSRSIAMQKAEWVWLEHIEGWEAKLKGDSSQAFERFRAAQDLAATRGFQFLTADRVAALPIDQLLERVEAARDRTGAPDTREAAAVLGGVQEPQLMLSGFVSHDEEISRYENRYKSDQQMRLWRNPRKRAVANLMTAVGGDRPVSEIGPAEARRHRQWWQTRITEEGQKADTANKDFNYLAGMLRRYYDDLGHTDPPHPYAGVSIRDRHKKKDRKPEIPVDWITERWFAPGALDGLNQEARDILLISIETGCRQSEIHDMPADAIQPFAEIPYINVAHEAGEANPDDRREVKNMPSERRVPLVGVALAAARRHPDGFPRYRHKRSYSAAVNSYMRENGLLPSPQHTVGGTRHTWEGRMKRARIESDDRGELMGHRIASIRGRAHYGDDMDLTVRQAIAQQIALAVPEHLK